MPLLVLLFIIVPIVELYVIVQVGQLIGLWPTLAVLLADALLGSILLKHQGRSAWRRFNEALTERRFPGKEVADGVLIIIGGTLLLTPGFLSDLAGLFLLVPPTRALARKFLRRLTIGRFTLVNFPNNNHPPYDTEAARKSTSTRSYDFDVSAEEMPLAEEERGLPQAKRTEEE